MNCIDCHKPSAHKVCKTCLTQRKTCARGTCVSKIRADSAYICCYKCTCAAKGCKNQCAEGDSLYCQSCLSKWNVHCYMCADQVTVMPFKTCVPCDTKRLQCENCHQRKAVFNVEKQVSFKYCRQCKCNTPQCSGANETTQGCCNACKACYCEVCKSKFASLGSDMCYSCSQKNGPTKKTSMQTV